MQCQVCSRAGPVAVPSRPRGGDTCCHTVACPAGGPTPRCTRMIQLPATQPCSEAHPRSHSSCRAPGVGFTPNPAGRGALGRRWMIWWHRQRPGAGSTYFFIIIIFLLLAARTAPGRCCHQAKAPLSWRLYGLRRAGGRHGGDTEWKPECDTQARGETQKKIKTQKKKTEGEGGWVSSTPQAPALEFPPDFGS